MATASTSAVEQYLGLIPGYDPAADSDGCYFNPDKGQLAVDFFEKMLTHCKGEKAGQPFMLEPFQKAIVGNLFGWVRDDGLRRYREAFLYEPRKNGKTVLAAGFILYGLWCDNEEGAEIYGAASEYKQASLVFEHVRGMIRNNRDLSRRLKVYNGQSKAVVLEETMSTYRVISSDPESAHGGNTHMAVIDELHALPSSELVDTLMTSTGARRQPLIIHITTADYDRPSICNAKLSYARKVRDGIISDRSLLPVIYEAMPDDDWRDPAVWRKANPNLGVSLSEEYLARECKRAEESAAYENTFKRLHLNIVTHNKEIWLKMEDWDACGEEVDWGEFEGMPCYAGLDLASTKDLTALALLFPTDERDYLKLWFWAPREGARERERKDRVPYVQWANQGHITLTDGDVTDYGVLRRDINAIAEQYRIKDIAVDRLFQGAQLSTDLMDDGHTVIAFGQGFLSMAAPTAEFERRTIQHRIAHDGNPVLRWMASNVTVKLDPAGNMKPDKQKSSEKIDGIVASIMAVGRDMVNSEDRGSVYDDPEDCRVYV